MAIFALYPQVGFRASPHAHDERRLHYIMLSLLAAVVYNGLFYAKNK